MFEEVDYEGQPLISTRWVITEKVKNDEVITKARLVARGFEEDTLALRKDSPTCSREAVRITLAMASSMQWPCRTVDAKSAYLQGNNITRPVYLQPPPEYNDGYVWKLKKTVYGLCDAARAWYMRVKEELLKLDLKMCSLDNSLFCWYIDEQLEGIMCVYVDDFFWAGSKEFEKTIIERLYKTFSMGNTASSSFKYIGVNVESRKNVIAVNQLHYAATLSKEPVSVKRRMNKIAVLSEHERADHTVCQLFFLWSITKED